MLVYIDGNNNILGYHETVKKSDVSTLLCSTCIWVDVDEFPEPEMIEGVTYIPKLVDGSIAFETMNTIEPIQLNRSMDEIDARLMKLDQLISQLS